MKYKPNFLVVGAARAGTTTLHHYLLSHKDVYVPLNKRPEPHFFLKDSEYHKGFDYYIDKYFSDVSDSKVAIGEISTSYIYQPWVAPRIKKNLPEIKLICLLRNPINRAYSNYLHSINSGMETLEFHNAIINENERTNSLPKTLKEIAPFSYVGRSLYYNQLNEYLKYFDKDKFCIICFEDFIKYPLATLNKIYSFLGVKVLNDLKMPQIQLNSTNNSLNITKETADFLKPIFKEDIKKLEILLNRSFEIWGI